MSNEIQTRQSQAPAQQTSLQQLVRNSSYTKRFEEVLKERAPQFMSSLISVGESMPDVEPKSIIAAAMQAAVLNLPIEKNFGFAWIVAYRDNGKKLAQFQIGSRGLIQLALRSGQYRRMNARCINKEALTGIDDIGEPVIAWDLIDESKPVYAYVFSFEMTNGFRKVACWTKSRVEAHARQYSQSFKGGYNSPWKTHFDAMALKTTIKNELSHWGMLSVELVKAMGADQAIQRTPEDEPEFLDVPTVSAPATVVDDNPELAPEPPKAAPVRSAVKTEPKTAKPAPAMQATATVPQSAAMNALLADDAPAVQEPESEPEPTAPTPAEPWTVQTELKNFCVGQNFGLGIFSKWALNAKWLTAQEVEDATSWDRIPQTIAVRCLRSKTGLVKGLTDTANGGGL